MDFRRLLLWCALLAMVSCQWVAAQPTPDAGDRIAVAAASACHGSNASSDDIGDIPADCHAEACQPGGQSADSVPVLFQLVIPAPERFILPRVLTGTPFAWATAVPPVFEPPNLRDARLLI